MALHVTIEDVQAWLETSKLSITSLDIELEQQITAETLGALQAAYPSEVTSWVDANTTPVIVKKIIAMQIAGWMYLRAYSESDEDGLYGDKLLEKAAVLLAAIVEGITDIVEVPGAPIVGQPLFFPTDTSSANVATRDNPSDGPPRFSMAQVF